jgi:hypothetical protein
MWRIVSLLLLTHILDSSVAASGCRRECGFPPPSELQLHGQLDRAWTANLIERIEARIIGTCEIAR